MSASINIHRHPPSVGSSALPAAADAKSERIKPESGHFPGGARVSVGDGSHGKRAKEACERNRSALSAVSHRLKSLFSRFLGWMGLRGSATLRLPERPPASSMPAAPPRMQQPDAAVPTSAPRPSTSAAPPGPLASTPATPPAPPASTPAVANAPVSAAPPLVTPVAPPAPSQADLLAQIQKGVSLAPRAPQAAPAAATDPMKQAILARRMHIADDDDMDEDDSVEIAKPTPSPATAARAEPFKAAPDSPRPATPENFLDAIQQGVKLKPGAAQPRPAHDAPEDKADPLTGLAKTLQERLQRHDPVEDSKADDDWDE